MNNKYNCNACEFFDTLFPYISFCSDACMLYNNLDYDVLKIIDDILEAERKERIELIDPRFEDGEPDFCGNFELIIHDKTYFENGIEKLILKWLNGYECTDYLIDCLRD